MVCGGWTGRNRSKYHHNKFSDFSSDLTHFLVQVKDFRPFLTQVVGAQTTEYETTLLEWALLKL